MAGLAPEVADQIGQQFKGTPQQGTAQHYLAHAVLGAAVAAATGNNVIAGAVSTGGGEALAYQVSNYLYGTDDPSRLSPDQKETISSIVKLGAVSTGGLLSSGDIASAVQGAQSAQTSVDNNYLSELDIKQMLKEIQFSKNKPLAKINF